MHLQPPVPLAPFLDQRRPASLVSARQLPPPTALPLTPLPIPTLALPLTLPPKILLRQSPTSLLMLRPVRLLPVEPQLVQSPVPRPADMGLSLMRRRRTRRAAPNPATSAVASLETFSARRKSTMPRKMPRRKRRRKRKKRRRRSRLRRRLKRKRSTPK